jgi:hypothetical protein
MLLSIFPGAKIEVGPVEMESVSVRDILGLLSCSNTVNRVTCIENNRTETAFLIKAGAGKIERVPAKTLLSRGIKVDQRFYSYG